MYRSWVCDDGIVISFSSDGSYDWRVPPDGPFEVDIADHENFKNHDDGSYSILDKWQVSGGKLALYMWGEADEYSLSFQSETKMKLRGYDSYTCKRR